MPQTIGFEATPMLVLDVDGGEARELLYFGGNADLYVLVDPCAGDEVFSVSVGSNATARDRRGHLLRPSHLGPGPRRSSVE